MYDAKIAEQQREREAPAKRLADYEKELAEKETRIVTVEGERLGATWCLARAAEAQVRP